jgi:hypothetical protein
VQPPAELPAGFIGHDHRTGPHRLAQRLVGRLAFGRDAVQGAHHGARRHLQTETLPKQGRDLAEGHAELLIELDRQRDRVRAELDARRAERIRGLQRMPALHPPLTPLTGADVNVEAPHHRLHRRQIFLILRRDLRLAHDVAAARALGWICRGHVARGWSVAKSFARRSSCATQV